MPSSIFKKEVESFPVTGESKQKIFEDAKNILRWHNSKEKTWIMWEETPGIFGIVHFSTNRQGAVNNFTYQYCYCTIDVERRLELEVSNPSDTTQNPEAAFLVISKKQVVSGPLVKSFIKQFVEKQHGRNKGIIKSNIS